MVINPPVVYWLNEIDKRTVTYLANPRYIDEESTRIDCDIMFTEFPAELLPFTASSKDSSGIGRDIFRDLVTGKYGEIAPYEAPTEG